MANPFLNQIPRDIETAIMLENAYVHDIGNAVAYTDGKKVFINTDDNLFNLLPAYDNNMLKWLLWHERYHMELRHHNRFFAYLSAISSEEAKEEFMLTKEEVNIIMDILVHDSLSKLFPELIETAVNNLAQMRNRNSLNYTFTTFTLEEMLDEYKKHKHPEDGEGEGKGTAKEEKEDGESKSKGKSKKEVDGDSKDKDGKEKGDKKAHKEGGSKEDKDESEKEDGAPEIKDGALPPEHDKTDWSKLDKLDSKEFIDDYEAGKYMDEINALKRMKARLGKLTETLNGLVTSTRRRTYAKPCTIQLNGGVILKGSTPGKTALYLCFDASGSMGRQLETFKEIISKSIPQAMDTPTEWFTEEYGKGKFKDILPVHAYSGFSDDGDRVIELCYKAEQLGYTPIGVTDGGGQISWSKDKLRALKRTILVGQNKSWLDEAKKINPRLQTLSI